MTNSQHYGSDPSTAFGLLAEPVQRWIWQKVWQDLRSIQEKAIHAILREKNDLIISAATAGGKTEAAFLPLISSLITSPSATGGFDIVYCAPLKALINDQAESLEDLCEMAEVPFHPWHGDISQSQKTKARKNPGGVLLITPESIEALFVLSPNPPKEGVGLASWSGKRVLL